MPNTDELTIGAIDSTSDFSYVTFSIIILLVLALIYLLAFCGAERPLVRRPTATRRCNGRSQLECWNWQAV